jgi:hypothetical protein
MRGSKFAVALAGVGCILATPAVAHADSSFDICPSGRSGIATSVTSCPFADNVRRAYFNQGGSTVVAYSPVTGQSYVMDCVSGYVAHFNNGTVRTAVKCYGGNNAEVVVW